MANSAIAVATYNNSGLPPLKNSKALVANANQRFHNFNTTTLNHAPNYTSGPGVSSMQMANRGATVTYDLPPRVRAVQGNGSLNATGFTNDMVQKVRSLTVNRSLITKFAYTDSEFVLNYLDYMPKFVTPAINAIGSGLEGDLANLGLTNTYRVYGDGNTAINSFQQIATAVALHRNMGATGARLECYLPSIIIPAIVNNGMGQFVLNRNEDMAEDWFIGSYNGVDIYASDELPVSNVPALTAGATLTLSSVTVAPDGLSTSLTFAVSGPGVYTSVANFLQAGQIIKFDANTSIGAAGALTFLGYQNYKPSVAPVTANVTTNADTNGSGNITVTVTPGLIYDAGTPPINQAANLSKPLVATMTAKVLPSHVCGLIVDANSLFLATPKLNHLEPFSCSEVIDPDTGLALRTYYGSQFLQGSSALVNDVLYGVDLPPDYATRIAIPYSQYFQFG